MRTETVVFFYVQKKAQGRRYPWQKTEFSMRETEWCERRVVFAGIPEYDWQKKSWRLPVLCKKIHEELLPSLSLKSWEKTAFLCQKSLVDKACLEALEQTFPLEMIRLPGKGGLAGGTPEDIVEVLINEYCRYDALIVIDGEAGEYLDLQEFIREHCRKVNYLAVITREEKRYEEILMEVQEEYGLAGMTATGMEQLKPSPKYQVLVVDAGLERNHIWRYLPSGCCYVDLFSVAERQRLVEERRKDVRYLSFYRQIEKKLRQR